MTYRVAVFPAACVCGRPVRGFSGNRNTTEFFVCDNVECVQHNVPLRLPMLEAQQACPRVVKTIMDQMLADQEAVADRAMAIVKVAL